jgi:hypothetical protein
MSERTEPAERRQDVRLDEDLIHTGHVTWVIVISLAVSVLLIIVSTLILHFKERSLGATPERTGLPPPDEAILFAREGSYAGDLIGAQQAVLDSYGWVDPARKTVRIPIERAMEIVAGEAK